MADAIKPALTPEEWAAERIKWPNGPTEYAVGRYTDRQNGMVNVLFVEHPDGGKGAGSGVPRDRELGMAALCLHGHPQGFTRADVALIRSRFDLSDDQWRTDEESAAASLAARIEALLPPEGA